MTLLGDDISKSVSYDDVTFEHASDMNEIVATIYTLSGNPVTHNLIPGTSRVCTFLQSGLESAETSDPSSTGDLELTISAYSTSYGGYPINIISLEFDGITHDILECINGIGLSAVATAQNATLTISAYVGRAMPSTDDIRWKVLTNETEVVESKAIAISSSLICDYLSDGKIYFKIDNRSKVSARDVSPMTFTLNSLSIITKTRTDNPNFQIY
jgi:hypothetical protein